MRGTARNAVTPEPGWVLVAHHDPTYRITIFRLVEREGHHATVTDDATEALALLRTEPFDVLLLDVRLLDAEGSLLAALREDAAFRRVPVIVVAEPDEIYDIARGLELGADDFLVLPFDPLFLRTRIERALEMQRMRERQAVYDEALVEVARFASATGAEDADPPDAIALDGFARRTDALGQLARAVRTMARRLAILRTPSTDARSSAVR